MVTQRASFNKINVDAVLQQRLRRYYPIIPKRLIRWLERTICQDGLNALLESNAGKTDADFCHGVLSDLNVSYDVISRQPISTSDSRVVFACNHPLGALDGIAMIDFVSKKFNRPVKFVVNDLLTAIEPLKGVFLPINKHGKQSRSSSSAIDEAFAGEDPIIVFPAGLVSRRQGNEIRDLDWHKMFVNKCIKHKRNIIPTYFSGENSKFFYNFARLRARTGLKFNIEMIYLPREVFRCKDSKFSIITGEPIDFNSLRGGPYASSEAESIKNRVYELKEFRR